MVKIVSIVVAVMVVLAGAFWYWNNKSSSSPSTSTTNLGVSQSSTAPSATAKSKITATDQSDGDVLVVDLAILEKPGFVVIHKATADGKPGTVVGHSALLEAKEHDNLDVDISPIAKKGDIYFAMLHEDTNSNKKYDDEATDAAVKDAQGNVVMAKFTITSTEAPPSASDTDTAPEEE